MTTYFDLSTYDTIVAKDLSLNGSISSALGGLSQWEDSGSDIYFNSGNVGIGTSSPDQLLQVKGANSDYPAMRLSNDSANFDIMMTGSSFNDALFTNRANGNIMFETTGNVGIGTTSPTEKLHLNGNMISSDYNGNLYFGDSSWGVGGGNNNIRGASSSQYYTDVFGYWSSGNDRGFRLYNSSNNTVPFFVNSDGNVGVGTTSPDAILEVAAPFNTGTSLYESSSIMLSAISSGYNVAMGSIVGYHKAAANNSSSSWPGGLLFRYKPQNGSSNKVLNDGMVLNALGNVGIGTTSPSVPLHVSRATTITLSGASSYFEVHNGFKTNGNNLSKAISIKATDGIVGSSVFANSDLRIKENINDILDDSALQKLRQLNPKMYQYKDKLSRGDKTVYGFIAQEVGDILPLAVQTQEDSIPNIIQLVSIDVDHKTLHFYQGFNTQNLDASFNTLRIIDKENKEHFVDIEEIIDASHIRVDTDLSEIMGDVDESGNIIEGNKVFVYGQQVDDFHILDKNAIFTIATAALQEVDRQLQAEKAKVADLEAKNATLETQMADVLARLSALENP